MNVAAAPTPSSWQDSPRPEWRTFVLPWLAGPALFMVLRPVLDGILSGFGAGRAAGVAAVVCAVLLYLLPALVSVLLARSSIVEAGPRRWFLAGAPGMMVVALVIAILDMVRGVSLHLGAALGGVLVILVSITAGCLLGGWWRQAAGRRTPERGARMGR